MTTLGLVAGFLLAGAPALLLGYDVSRCLAFYRETRARAASLPRPPAARPRSLTPDQVTLRHALLFLAQKASYYWQAITAALLLGRLHLRPAPATARDVALLIVETSLATWTTTRALPGGGVAVTLRIEGFAFPLLPGRHDNVLVVETELWPGADAASSAPDARPVRFELNGVPIAAAAEQLSILAIMVSSVTHPVVHSFNNRVYASHAELGRRGLDDLVLHGQYLNWCAWFWPGLLFRIGPRGHHWYRRVLAFNAELRLPPHGRATLAPLLPYSPNLRFLLAARPVLAELCRRHALPVDGEALFLCSVLHAIDHVGCDRHTRGRMLRHEQLPDRGFWNLIALVFYRPAQHFWTNRLRDKRACHPLYGELYAALHAVDPGLADEVTLSISY